MTQQETTEAEDTLQRGDVLQEDPAQGENAGSDAVPEEDGNQTDGDVTEEPGEAEDPGEEEPSEPAAPQVTVKLNTVEHIRYMNGSSSGMFNPSSALTKAEAAQMIYSLLLDASEADVVQNISFRDEKGGRLVRGSGQ